MATNTTAQIATFLNVSPNQIKSVTEMAWVFCVVVKGCRARFVSKKVVKEQITMSKPITKAEQKRDTKELVFSGSEYRVILGIYGQSETVLFSGDESTARQLFNALDAREVVSMY